MNGNPLKEEKQFLEDGMRHHVHTAIQAVNAEKVRSRKKNLWEIPYFTTSETEDNDTEESDKEDNFENNQEYAMLKARETITV